MHTLRINMLSAINGIFLCKENFVQRFHINSILVPRIIYMSSKISSCNSQSCVTLTQPNKDLIARKKLNEFLENFDNSKQYKILQLEIEVMRQNGENVPNELKDRHWLELILLNSRSKRRRYLDFIFGLERKKEHQLEKRKNKSAEIFQTLEQSNLPCYLQYKLGGNSPFLRFRDRTIHRFYNWRLMKAMMYGQKVIMDCSYEDKMSRSEIKNCAKQLQISFASNRMHNNPLDLIFCNFNSSGFLHEEFFSFIPTMYDPDFPMNITTSSYLDLFDKQKLVYLTPDCHQELDHYDYDDIYIIGALVDKVSGQPLSLAKAKRDGLRMAKLPIDKYLHFGCGSRKSLTLNQMVLIIADMQQTQDWQYALRHIPKRKLHENRILQMEKRINTFLKHHPTEFSTLQDYSLSGRKKFRLK